MGQEIVPASIDYRKIPSWLCCGLWLLIKTGPEQEILAAGRTPTEAMEHAGVEGTAPNVILTKAPSQYPVVGCGFSVNLEEK